MIIETGIACDRTLDGKPVPFEIRVLSEVDRKQIDLLQAEIAEKLGNAYIPASPANVAKILDQHFSLGFFVDNVLQGIRLVFDQRPLTDAIRGSLALTNEPANQVAQLCGIYIRPRFAGNQLGFRITEMALQRLKQLGRNHVYSTVAPANFHSLRNLFDMGFISRAPIEMAEGAKRLVLHAQLQVEDNLFIDGEPEFLDAEDFTAQRTMSEIGKVGTKVVKEQKSNRIGFLPANKRHFMSGVEEAEGV